MRAKSGITGPSGLPPLASTRPLAIVPTFHSLLLMPSDRTSAERRAAEVIQTWLEGAIPDAAAALARNPDFEHDKSIVLDLAFAEFLIREHKGERLDAEAFCARFPEHHASLCRILAQQSVADNQPGLDAAIPNGLAERTISTPVTPMQAADSGPRTKSPSTEAASAQSPGSGSSITKRSGPAAWPEAGGRVGDFNLLRQLGKGAFGRVFLAMEEPTTRHVVVKISKQKCDEAKVLGRLGHRNVVSVLSAPHDQLSGLYLVVMPYHGSATLEDLLELAYPLRRGSSRPRKAEIIAKAARRNMQPDDPTPSEPRPDPFLMRAGFTDGIVWLGVRMAEALAAVHHCGFVHHDLKPSNVLLGLDGHPRVLDFNLASDVRNQKSRLGGTLPYMPPEHLQAVRHPEPTPNMDARGDIYSLGVILYELLAGTHPFGRFPRSRSVRTVADEMLARQKLGVRPLRERNPDVPHRLARLVESCLAFDPNDRPQTAAIVAAEMRKCYSARKRAMQFIGSRPGRVGVTAAAIGLVSAASWMASAQARPEFLIEDHRAIGMSAVNDGRYADAVPALVKATQETPDDADAWLALGRARLAQAEWRTARPDLERAAELRPSHGPTLATLGWCLAKLGHHADALATLERAEKTGYAPAGLHALRGFSLVTRRNDAEAVVALDKALELNPQHRAALVNRAQLALMQSMSKVEPLPLSALTDVERALTAGPPDGNLYLWAARFYAWLAHKPPRVKGEWYPDHTGAKERCRTLLQQAVESGAAEDHWKSNSTFQYLLGNPDVYARDWVRPAKEASPANNWRTGDALVEFPG
jgi:eukaryotic-like serine/threonine-protein kinase